MSAKRQKAKIVESEGYGATFTGLRGFSSDGEEGGVGVLEGQNL